MRSISLKRNFRHAAAATLFSAALISPELHAQTDVSVQRQYIGSSEGYRKLQDEVKMSEGKVTGITLVVQTLDVQGGKSGYLVAKVPQDAIDKLNSDMSGKTPPEKEYHLRSWVVEKKKLLVKYYYSRKKAGTFTADLDRADPPQEKQRSIDFSGAGRQATVEGPKVGRSIVSTSLPRQVKEGEGTASRRFVVEPMSRRSITPPGNSRVEVPMTMSVKTIGPVYFTVRFTYSQLTDSARGEVAEELEKVLRKCIEAVREKQNVRNSGVYQASLDLAMGQLPDYLSRVKKELSAKDPEARAYLK
ncbi:hypothetical protein JXA56_04225 [Candidatus Micrarchaeota archaeon]|nr:hypothetical protein [Candidatus Micrarchaeota archaeon]